MSRCTMFSFCAAAMFAATPALAGDQFPPPWPRFESDGTPVTGVTFQCWTFPTPFSPAPPDPARGTRTISRSGRGSSPVGRSRRSGSRSSAAASAFGA